MIQMVFPEIEQDLSKRFSLGGQEKPRVAWCLISGDSDPHSWVPAHPGWVWLFYSHQAQQPDSLFASACCPASLFDFLGPCPCPSSYVIYTQFQFLFWSWLGLGQTLLLVCRTPSVHLCAIWEEMVIYIYLNQRQDFFWSCFQIWGICPAATRISWRKVYQGCWFSKDCIEHAASKRLYSSDFPSCLKSTLIQSICSESWLWTRHCAGATDKKKKKKKPSLWCPDYAPTWKAFHRVTIKTLWES